MNDNDSTPVKATQATRPFPWKCGECGERTIVATVVPYTITILHDGQKHQVTVPDLEIPRCQKCSHMIATSAVNRRVDDALRQQLRLLSPEEIRRNREILGLSGAELARRLGILESTVCDLESGWHIQDRPLDNLMRLFFTMPAVRAVLTGNNSGPISSPVGST
jgi:DNA-binding transcriptional regulator YiaG